MLRYRLVLVKKTRKELSVVVLLFIFSHDTNNKILICRFRRLSLSCIQSLKHLVCIRGFKKTRFTHEKGTVVRPFILSLR